MSDEQNKCFYFDFKKAFSKNRHHARVAFTKIVDQIMSNVSLPDFGYITNAEMYIPKSYLTEGRFTPDFLNYTISEHIFKVVAIKELEDNIVRVYCEFLNNHISNVVNNLWNIGFTFYIGLDTINTINTKTVTTPFKAQTVFTYDMAFRIKLASPATDLASVKIIHPYKKDELDEKGNIVYLKYDGESNGFIIA